MKPGIYEGLTMKEYGEIQAEHKSGLDKIAKSPHTYKFYKENPPSDPTPSMKMGSLVHCLYLQPWLFDNEYVVEQDFGDCRKKENKEKKAEWLNGVNGRTVVSASQSQKAGEIMEALRNHPIAGEINKEVPVEQSLVWEDEETGMLLKGRVDLDLAELNAIADLKTTANADSENFAKSCYNFRYDVQAALYLDGKRALSDHRYKNFMFIVVENSPPYSVAVYVADAEMVESGRRKYQNDLRKLKWCLEHDRWPGYSEKIETISLPAWAL